MSTKLRDPITFETTFSKYVATSILGEGGAGLVYKTTDETGRLFAVKVLAPDRVTNEKLKRFKNEWSFCSRNKHPNIVTAHDHGIHYFGKKKSSFYVMPLYPQSLRDLMSAKISTEKALVYFGHLLNGVEAAHLEGVIHRDLKPENVLYDPPRDRLLVADFGIAQFAEEDLYTLVETAPTKRLANFQYAAPEQRARGLQVDCRADIYALGLILNEMFTGEIPQGTGYKTIEKVVPDFVYLDEIVSSMLRQSPAERPASIEAIKKQLIAHKNEFITRQRISALKETVIPTSEIDDPLIIDPVQLVECDWYKGKLTLQLSRPVNANWVDAFMNMGRYESLYGKGPVHFKFEGDKATVAVEDYNVQPVIDHFKTWLITTRQVYEKKIRQEKEQEEIRLRDRLQQELEEQERRQRVLKNVKI